jgi:hypothetical protein
MYIIDGQTVMNNFEFLLLHVCNIDDFTHASIKIGQSAIFNGR